jgi:hypothetical protein
MWNWGDQERTPDVEFGMGKVAMPWMPQAIVTRLDNLQMRAWTDTTVTKEQLTEQAEAVTQDLKKHARDLTNSQAAERLAEMSEEPSNVNAVAIEAKGNNEAEIEAYRQDALKAAALRVKEMRALFKTQQASVREEESETATIHTNQLNKAMSKHYGE